jgi:hypothetical protein
LSALNPYGELEATLAERIVIDTWRLRRIPLLESALYRRGHQESVVANQEQEVERYEYTDMDTLRSWDFEKTKVADGDRRAHNDASARLKESRLKLDEPAVQITMVFQKYSDTFANLSRHETALSRSFLKNLHELQRLQATRAGVRSRRLR